MENWLKKTGMAAVAVLAAAPRLLAQGCVMCYADASAQSAHAKRQLDLAILTLLVPSVLLFLGVLLAAFRRRERDVDGAEQQESSDTRLPRPISTRPRTLPAPNALL